MIVRPHQHWFPTLFTWRGSVLPNILPRLALNFGVAVLAVLALPYFDALNLHITTAPFSLLGISIAIFLGFRNNTSYARFNEARCLWGSLLITGQTLTREIKNLGFDTDDVRFVTNHLIAFVWSLNHQLRGTDASSNLRRLLPPSSYASVIQSPLRTNRIVMQLGEWLTRKYQDGKITDIIFTLIDKRLNEMTHVQGCCERIASTPIPFAYVLILKRTVYLFCTVLPFALIDDLRYLTPLVTVFISYTFLAMESVAEEIEEPFGEAPNDLALNAICTTIEINLLEMNDVCLLPESVKADQNFNLI